MATTLSLFRNPQKTSVRVRVTMDVLIAILVVRVLAMIASQTPRPARRRLPT